MLSVRNNQFDNKCFIYERFGKIALPNTARTSKDETEL